MTFQTVKGTRDFLPDDMEKRRYVFDKIRSVYSKFGFNEMQTPAFEYLKTLIQKSGEAIKDEIYHFKDKSDRELGLRFDLTVPLARIIGSNTDIPKPFKRFCISRVWRYDQPQAGRYREFWQADVDVVGSSSVNADVECVAAAVTALKELGLENFTVRVNNRKMVQGYLESINVEDMDEAFRIIDKLDKIGFDGVQEELKKKGFPDGQIESIRNFLENNDSTDNELYKQGSKELAEFEKIANDYGLNIEYDQSLVRGLGYYTGLVFEISLEGATGSVGGGGRYDNLTELYGDAQPAVGISIGVDRIIGVMEERGLFENIDNDLVYVISVNDKVRDYVISLVKELRDNNIVADYDIMGRKIGKQISYANSIGARFSIVVGPDEISKNVVSLKDMESGNEKQIPRDELVTELKSTFL